MTADTFEAFRDRLIGQGYPQTVVREWAPDTVLDRHAHPFAVRARVVRGEMWLTVADDVRHLQAGDAFEVGEGIVHAERYGPAGATVWVGRRPAATG